MTDYTKEIQKRRTFAIISHPDAGKTTLTEKFLLYGGAINLAGSVKGKVNAANITAQNPVFISDTAKETLNTCMMRLLQEHEKELLCISQL